MSSSTELLSLASGLVGGSADVQGIFHEVSAITIFAVSFMLWHYVKTQQLPNHSKPAALSTKLAPAELAQDKGLEKSSQQQRNESTKSATQKESVQEAEQQMCAWLEQKEFTRALYMFKSLERSGRDQELKDEGLFSSFVKSAILVGKFDVVDKMLRTIKRNGVEPTLSSWKTMLKLLSTRKRFTSCLLAFSLFEETIPADQVIFSCLINAALDNKMPQEAAKMLVKYKNADSNPKDWILFFRTYVAVGNVEQAEATFRDVGSEMTPLMLNLLLLTCVQAKQLDRAETCLKMAHDFEKNSATKIVNVVSYNTIIKGFAQLGLAERCFACLQGLFQHGIEPDESTVGMLVDACDGHAGIADKLVKALRQSGTTTSTAMCTHFLKVLIKTERLNDAADLYDDMKRREHTKPDLVTCSLLINAYINAKDLERALCVLDDLTASGVKPDDRILTRLLDGYRQAGCCDRGIALFERFVKMGVAPSDYTILALLKLMGNTHNHAAAHELVASCEKRYGTKPSVIHFTCLMSAAVRGKSYEHAWQAYILMSQNGVRPDATAITTVLPGLVLAQHWDRVVELASSALKDASPPLNIPVPMLNNALSQMIAENGPPQHVCRLQSLMKGAGLAITARQMS